jgi:hypothetical protein
LIEQAELYSGNQVTIRAVIFSTDCCGQQTVAFSLTFAGVLFAKATEKVPDKQQVRA